MMLHSADAPRGFPRERRAGAPDGFPREPRARPTAFPTSLARTRPRGVSTAPITPVSC